MEGKVVVVTGGNSGLGLETAYELAQLGAQVIITSRDPAKGRKAIEDLRKRPGGSAGRLGMMPLDLASFASIRSFASEFEDRFDRLDVLVNNAGGMLTSRTTTQEGFETTFGVNHLGHFLLTNLLLDVLKKSAPSRIVNVSSDAHKGAKAGLDFDDLQGQRNYNGWHAYQQSKLANILFTKELARRLDGTGVTVNCLHPGFVMTGFGQSGDMTGPMGFGLKFARLFGLRPRRGARTIVYLASAPEVADVSGEYFVKKKVRQPTAAAQDPEAARRLWEVSERLVAEHSPFPSQNPAPEGGIL